MPKETLMSDKTHQCAKCNGQMEQGFILDNTYGGRIVGHWAAGAPKKAFLGITKMPEMKPIPMGAFRCSTCGYVEYYAREEFAPK